MIALQIPTALLSFCHLNYTISIIMSLGAHAVPEFSRLYERKVFGIAGPGLEIPRDGVKGVSIPFPSVKNSPSHQTGSLSYLFISPREYRSEVKASGKSTP